MLTSEDIQKLLEVLATKEDVAEIKTELLDLKETVHELIIAIDRLAKAVDDLRIEYAAVVMKVDRHEKWFHQIAEKLGIKLEY
ncbi:MAG: hypothetical protein HYW95_01950 [Candidatus Wildermuthbacteria bacterium]|nr:hypothetical protein [Candidatus Wildermuthbacteria bacterium]